MLMRDDLLEVARNFEEVDGQLRTGARDCQVSMARNAMQCCLGCLHLRRAQIRAAVRRAFLTSAAQVKLHRKAAEAQISFRAVSFHPS